MSKEDESQRETPLREEHSIAEEEKWETDEEILQGDYLPPYYSSYAMQKWAGYGFPDGYAAKAEPEKYARRRRIYNDYVDGLRPLLGSIGDYMLGTHQIALKKFLKRVDKETGEENTR